MAEVRIVNLTPHDVNIVGDVEVTIPASGDLARVAATTDVIGSVNGIPLTANAYGEVTGLPDEQENTIFIVSALVANALKGVRDDLVIPNEAVRDEAGRIIGCKSLGRV